MQESPWIEPVLEPVFSFEGGFQRFNSYHSGSRYCNYHGRDKFLEGNLYFATCPDLSFQLEIRFTQTHYHRWAIDQVKQAMQYAILDDARGDLLAFSVGIELAEPIPIGIKDIGFIHHGPFELEVHAAFGKEWSLEGERISRIYGLAALGFGIEAYPWIRGFFASEQRLFLRHLLGAKLLFGGGLGDSRLRKYKFRGYKEVAYRFVDAAFEYTYIGDWGDITFKYVRSIIRQNMPYAVQQLSLHVILPFKL